MSFKVTGNWGKAHQLVSKLRDAPKLLTKLAEAQQETALNLISDGFRAGSDPYGNS